MNIKDFKPGQIAYALMERRGKIIEHSVLQPALQHTVIFVGRKYVYTKPVKGGYEAQFFKLREEDEYLTEKEYCGYNRLKLFPTETEAQEYIEKAMLMDWLRREVECRKIKSHSLEQLRAVRKILDGKDDG